MIAVGLQCTVPSATTDFSEFYINDNGGGKYLTPRINHKNGLVNNYSGGSWSYDPYDPPEDISNMEDFDFRIEKPLSSPTQTQLYPNNKFLFKFKKLFLM